MLEDLKHVKNVSWEEAPAPVPVKNLEEVAEMMRVHGKPLVPDTKVSWSEMDARREVNEIATAIQMAALNEREDIARWLEGRAAACTADALVAAVLRTLARDVRAGLHAG